MSTDNPSVAVSTTEPLRPRVGTIIWGVILIGIASLLLLGQFGWLDALPKGAVPIILVAGIGGLLVLGAIIGALSSRTTAANREPTERRN
jgi:hypothetical protein